MNRSENLNLSTYESFAQSSSGSLNKIFHVQKFPRASLLACRREIRVPFAATRRRVIRRGEHAQRNGSQILCAFVVSGAQRRDDRSREICTHGCCAFARVASMNRPRIPRARWYAALLRCCLISGVHCVQISTLNPLTLLASIWRAVRYERFTRLSETQCQIHCWLPRVHHR